MNFNKKLFLSLFFISCILFSSYSIFFVAYQGATKKIITDHFVILFPKKYEKIAKKTAAYAEDIHLKIANFMKWESVLKTTIIITDHTDFPNGMSVTFFRNTIYLYITPLDLYNNLRSYEDPLYSLIVHEYTHTLHLDQIRGGAWFWRIMYGKLYCPNSGTFRWYLEGVAILSETLFSEGGRLKASYNHALVKSAAKQKKIPSYDKLVLPVVEWPNGEAVYHYGASFVEYIYYKYGEEKFQEFFIDISNDFWPFVLQFVMKFKKIYGISLNDLWNEWKEYEENKALEYSEPEYSYKQLTNLNGSILSMDRGNDYFIISSNSYNNDSYLYKLYDNGSLKKIHLGYHRSVTLTNNEDYILFTSGSNHSGGFYYFNLYSLNLTTNIKRKVTGIDRINYVSFAKNSPNGVFVSHSGFGSKLYKAEFYKGSLRKIREIKIPAEIEFIDAPSVNSNGEEVVFAARVKDKGFRLFLLNLNDNSIILIDDTIEGKNARWISDDTISYVSFDESSDSIYSFNISTKINKKILSTYNSIIDGIIEDNNLYFVDYTINGEELFVSEINQTVEKVNNNFTEIPIKKEAITKNSEIFELNDKNWDITTYTGFRYLYPRIWGILPFQLSSSIYYSIGNGFLGIPLYGPKFFIYNILPQGRFSYYFDLGFDYIKFYPENNAYLSLKLPYINLSYNWSNWKGGSKDLINNIWYSQKYFDDYPINFLNSLSANYTYSFGDGFDLSWYISATHLYNQYNFYLMRSVNFLYFTEGLSFSYIKPRNKSSRWDRGIALNLNLLQYPLLLDNYLIHILRGSVIGRIPCGSAFYFINVESGFEFFLQNVFRIDSDLYRFSENILSSSSGNSSNSLSIIDTKAFPSLITASSYGSFFLSADTGFDITIYKKSKYWHFATLGFKEFYIKPYFEFVYLYNSYPYNEKVKGILFDGVIELAIDLFAAYGNISTTIVLGGALGYRVGDNLPAWSVFTYFKAGL